MKKRILLVVFVLSVLFTSSVSTSGLSDNVFMKNTQAGKRVALTFDDGPHPRYTPQILAILEEYGIKATFFVIGQNIDNYPEAFEAILQSGCEIGNHTYTHKNMAKMSEEEIEQELSRTEEAVARFTDIKLKILRPPQGAIGVPLERVSRARGYDVILWSIDTLDWANTPSDTIAANVMKSLCGGDIILMHDYTSNRGITCSALKKMIPAMIAKGYEFVTVSELLCDEM